MPGIFAEKTKCTVPDFSRMLNRELVAELRQQVYNGMEKFSPLRALVEEVARRLMHEEEEIEDAQEIETVNEMYENLAKIKKRRVKR